MQEFLKDGVFFLLGIGLEAPKGKDWKTKLFILPFLSAAGIVLFLLGNIFFVGS